jgi:hypothetical protein
MSSDPSTFGQMIVRRFPTFNTNVNFFGRVTFPSLYGVFLTPELSNRATSLVQHL